MNKHNDGGSAFPCMPPQDTAAGSAVGYPHPGAGMSLRDYFAAHAPPPPEGWLRFEKKAGDLVQYAADLALWRRLYADAMLTERAKGAE